MGQTAQATRSDSPLPRITEKQFQRQVIQLARLLGWAVFHPFDSRRSQPGFPDLVLVHPKRGIVFAELKTETGKPTPAQSDWMRVLIEAAAVGPPRVHLWRPNDLNEIARILGEGT